MKERAARLAGPTARAMDEAYKLAAAGQRTGTLQCPACGSQLRFSAGGAPHNTTGRCPARNCIRWSS